MEDSALFTANPYGLTFTETALACLAGLAAGALIVAFFVWMWRFLRKADRKIDGR